MTGKRAFQSTQKIAPSGVWGRYGPWIRSCVRHYGYFKL